jgi:hypothetical protein
VSSKLITKLRILGLNTSLCKWILDFLMGRPQWVRVGTLNVSNTKELIVDYRKRRAEQAPIKIDGL